MFDCLNERVFQCLNVRVFNCLYGWSVCLCVLVDGCLTVCILSVALYVLVFYSVYTCVFDCMRRGECVCV